MQQQLSTMLEMQDRMNTKVHPEWVNQHFEWYRALWIECGELIDHWGYKWWKHQRPDVEQAQLEVIDIWHFGMSMCFDGQSTVAEIAADIAEQWQAADAPAVPMLEAIESLAGAALVERRFAVEHFCAVMRAAGLDLDALYRQYVGKNVLNFFRQDHGYKEGSYRKQWQGREDNEHLVELLAQMDANAADFPDRLYASLEERYEKA